MSEGWGKGEVTVGDLEESYEDRCGTDHATSCLLMWTQSQYQIRQLLPFGGGFSDADRFIIAMASKLTCGLVSPEKFQCCTIPAVISSVVSADSILIDVRSRTTRQAIIEFVYETCLYSDQALNFAMEEGM